MWLQRLRRKSSSAIRARAKFPNFGDIRLHRSRSQHDPEVRPGANNKVATIRFQNGSAKLTSAARREIKKAAAVFKQRRGGVHVIGHASSRTRNLSLQRHQLANFRVSFDRAHVVARELRRLGVAATSIRVSAVSDTQPAFLEVMPAGEAGNRRVEIVLEN